ncbi:hypothetical protein AB0H73_39140 [Streptomyces olivoreticuli]
MKMRLWYRRWWLTELMALAAGGLTMLALYKGLGWNRGRQIWAVFLTGALVVTAAGEAPLRKARERERAAGAAKMHKLLDRRRQEP